MRKKGFTLIEIMMVIMIIGLLLAVAVPQWIRARELSRFRTCVSNLRTINHSKEQFAMETNLNNGAPCAMADIWPAYIKTTAPPSCPSGGNYTIGNIGEDPTCSYQIGTYPHVL
jgi:prepilin-type N-terminal cleavage/methylation domain-containing protein